MFSLSLGYIRQEPHTALTDKIMGEKRRVAIPGVSLREGGAVLLLFLFARHSVPVLVPVRASPVLPSVVRGSFDLCVSKILFDQVLPPCVYSFMGEERNGFWEGNERSSSAHIGNLTRVHPPCRYHNNR